MFQILDGKAISLQIKDEIANEVRSYTMNGHRPPHLAAILVGEDGASKTYVANKEKSAHEVGFISSVYRYSENTSEEELLKVIDFLNKDDETDGFIVQLPLPKHISEQNITNAISPEKDVDGFTAINTGRFVIGDERAFLPATPMGIVNLLQRYNIETQGKHCVVVGRSNIVGKPMAHLLLQHNATVTIAHSRTKDLKEVVRRADIIIAAVGKPRMITSEYVKEGAVIIDVGINRDKETGKLCGDVDFDDVAPHCTAITPVPGGVGPMTIAMLMKNCLELSGIRQR